MLTTSPDCIVIVHWEQTLPVWYGCHGLKTSCPAMSCNGCQNHLYFAEEVSCFLYSGSPLACAPHPPSPADQTRYHVINETSL